MDKELDGRSQPGGGGQWLYVQVETGNKECPPGAVFRPVLFNIFISNVDGGIECFFSRLANDTKLSGAIITAEGMNAIRGTLINLKGGPL